MRTIAAAVARLLMGWIFIDAGADVLVRPAARVQVAGPALARIRTAAPQLPASDTILVRANAAVQVLGGLALARGRRPRTAALVLATSLAPTTLAAHPFWQVTDPAQRSAQRLHFDKNLAILGGLLLAASARRT